METFVGLDVSLKDTSVCVLNQTETLVFEGKIVSEPKAISLSIGTQTGLWLNLGAGTANHLLINH